MQVQGVRLRGRPGVENRGSVQLSRQPWGDGTASYCLSLERLVVTAAAALPAVLRELGLPAHSVALLRLVECILAPAAFLPQPLRAEAGLGTSERAARCCRLHGALRWPTALWTGADIRAQYLQMWCARCWQPAQP